MLTSSDDCILSSGTYEHVSACSRADARYTTGSSGHELLPFELPGVSKIEFATDRRSFATRLLIPPDITPTTNQRARKRKALVKHDETPAPVPASYFVYLELDRANERLDDEKNVSPQLIARSYGIFARPILIVIANEACVST